LTPPVPSEAERGRSVLAFAILAFRWVSLAWLSLVALGSDLERPLVAAGAIVVTVAWTAWLTVARPRPSPAVLAVDLGLAVALNLLSGWVVPAGQVVGDHPFFASAYPVAADAFWGATLGFRGGLAAGAVVGLSLAGSHLVNGIDVVDESVPQLLHLASGMLNHVIAGGAVGLVAELLARSAAQLQRAVEETMQARERAARLAERESLARQIHDSVLQALAMVHKRGRELAAGGQVPAAEVARLAEMAGAQEEALRTLVLREPREWPTGTASLRAELEALARAGSPPPVTVSATGPITLPVRHVERRACSPSRLSPPAGLGYHARAIWTGVPACRGKGGACRRSTSCAGGRAAPRSTAAAPSWAPSSRSTTTRRPTSQAGRWWRPPPSDRGWSR